MVKVSLLVTMWKGQILFGPFAVSAVCPESSQSTCTPDYGAAASFMVLRLPLLKLSATLEAPWPKSISRNQFQKMVHYVHIISRQHGITSSRTDDQIVRLGGTDDAM